MANASTQLAPVERKPKTIADMIIARKEAFGAVLPKHLSADRFVKIAIAALTKSPDLAKCTIESLLMALAACSELGLEPNSPLGHAYLIPFENSYRDDNGQWRKVMECQLIIGFKGLLSVARRSGEIASISVRAVYERDVFEVKYGDEESIHHTPFVPKLARNEKGEPTGFEGPENAGRVAAAYMIAHLKDGSVQREVMWEADLLAIKARAKGMTRRDGTPNPKSPWTTDFAEMARKTVFRRGWKWLPQSTEMAKAVSYDQDGPAEIVSRNPQPVDVSFTMAAPAPQIAPSRGDSMAAELEAHAEVSTGGAQTTMQEPAAPPSEPSKRRDVAEADAPPDVRGDFE